jgi:hypothetical protein
MRAQGARGSPENPRIQNIIRADPRKADVLILLLVPIRRLRFLINSHRRGSLFIVKVILSLTRNRLV